ncbi:TPA: trp operon leader peptide [Salmonella enterica subsp. enterica serovar Enteritidis]|nr:trp operon leader peptide [Salmonella enterica]EJN2878884.1 trp operon leader peptide [Salmonella enterica subsp. enterica serovar Goelzau]EKY3754492.1 trp operon leader peptide [Salmonella enterica]ELX4030414.1 trp operon leader peptide [Salmonella enterica]
MATTFALHGWWRTS